MMTRTQQPTITTTTITTSTNSVSSDNNNNNSNHSRNSPTIVPVSSNDDVDQVPSSIRRVKVAIVGAGAAGLQCAHDLLTRQQSIVYNHIHPSLEPQDIVILEARNRIGGRIYSTHETRTSVRTQEPVNFVMDHGAAWIHGTGMESEEDDKEWVGRESMLRLPDRDHDSTFASTTTTTPSAITSSSSSSSSLKSSTSSSSSSSKAIHSIIGKNRKNPMMVLLEQATPIGKCVFGTHVKPIVCGNPWMRPEFVLHNHNEIVLFVNGNMLESHSPLIQQALLRHFDIFDQVSDVGDDMYEKGLGIETSRTSLQETITKIVTIQKQKQQIAGDSTTSTTDETTTTWTTSSSEDSTSNNNNNLNVDDKNVVERVANFYQHLMECWFGCPSNHLPLADFVEDTDDESILHDERYTPEGDFPGPHCVVTSGMKTLLQPLLQDGVESCIQLQQPVTKIALRKVDPDQQPQPQEEDNHDFDARGNHIVELQTSNGMTIHADCCVLSIPLGCLQRAIRRSSSTTTITNLQRDLPTTEEDEDAKPLLSFEPSLSEEKIEAIHALRMGCYKKVFLTFDRIFWPPQQSFLGLIRSNVVTITTTSRNSTSGDSTHLGNYLLFDNLWARDGIPCLEAILISQAGEWSIGKSDEVIRNAVLGFLQDSMNNGNDDNNNNINVFDWCQDCHVTRWEEDTWSCGAYSSFAVGTLERHADALAQSEYNGQLVFCGEATCSEFEGSVHAALMSGERASASVHEYLSLLSSSSTRT